jgi:hypothetical protein
VKFMRQLSLFLASTLLCGAAIAQEPPASPTASSPTFSAKGSLDGVTFTVTRLKRNANGTLTLSLRLQGSAGTPVRAEAIGFSGDSPWKINYKLLDMVNKKRYSMLEDSDGHCVCTKLVQSEMAELASGKAKDINIKFPAPPADVKSISVELPHAEPIDDVPISD